MKDLSTMKVTALGSEELENNAGGTGPKERSGFDAAYVLIGDMVGGVAGAIAMLLDR